jgi:hypothetical protein
MSDRELLVYADLAGAAYYVAGCGRAARATVKARALNMMPTG